METTNVRPRSLAVNASWAALGLALGGACLFLAFLLADQLFAFEHTSQGVLISLVPRSMLNLAWAGEALAVVAGIGSFLCIRRPDIESHDVAGIVGRSLVAVTVGLCGTVFLWLIVGHIVIGF